MMATTHSIKSLDNRDPRMRKSIWELLKGFLYNIVGINR
jgi:hypothetical protein